MSTRTFNARRRKRKSGRAKPKKSNPAGNKKFLGLELEQKVKQRDVIAFSRELATLMESGLPAVPALELLLEQRKGKGFEPVIRALIEDLQSGFGLAEAMARHPKVFNHFYVTTVSTSDRGAPLVDVLRQAADFMDTAESALAQAKKAMLYPAIVMTLGLSVTVVMLVVALPPMIGLFESLDTDLPLPTRVLIWLSGALREYKLQIGGGLVATVLGLYQYVRTQRGHMQLHRLMLKTPLLSSVVVKNDIARVSTAMHSLTSAGLTLAETVEVASQTASNEVIKETLQRARVRMLAGDGMAVPLAETGVFPLAFTQALKVGEDTGTLEANLKRMSDFYQREASDTVQGFVGLLEPLSTVIVALAVGFIAMAVIMPMYSALGAIDQVN
ncbi:MAG: type II secretion system F family protein [Chloroflexota bacterium]